MQQIIINKTVETLSKSATPDIQSVSSGEHFEQYVESQKKGIKADGSIKKKGLSAESAVVFREETSHILSYCNPHNATDKPEATHLVVGYVQSGKTMSFTGLSALALDNGYKVIVFLAGTKNNLLEQTTNRLRKDLIGTVAKNSNYYKIHPNPTIAVEEEIAGHIESTDKPIILIPILKHYNHINNLTALFKSTEMKDAMNNETVLIIDDEADQASLNSYGRKNSKKAEYEAQEESRTYEAILKLRAALPGNTYIQYTATPQANILISMQDLLSPKSHTLLTPGSDYIGGKLFFGKGQNHELFRGGLIKQIPEDQVFHKKRNALKKIPQSLIDALMLHIMAVAIVVKWAEVEDVPFLSMMVHPDNTKKWNLKFKKWIDAELKNWRIALRKPDGQDDKVDLLEKFENLFPMAVEYYSDEEQPTFEQIKPFILDILNDKKVYLINSDKEVADTKIEWNNYKMHILVGAEMLNRGFTVENLATTYMPRYSVGATNADTIQQRCRFFGYKSDYIKSCRVFLPKSSIVNYIDYVAHEEELRATLNSCNTLAEAERKILLSPRLKPTRQNILPISVVNTQLKGMQGMQAFESKSLIENNKKVVESFLETHKNDFDIEYKYTTKDRTHRGFKLSIDEAITFLADFRFGNYFDARRKADTIRYLRYLSSSDNEHPLEYVYFIQMAWDADIRHRNFDAEKLKLASNIFAGQSSDYDSTDYPGDRKIVENDSLTIQLYHFILDNATLDFAHSAYTLAINYPEKLAVNYCSNEEHNQDEEDDENESE